MKTIAIVAFLASTAVASAQDVCPTIENLKPGIRLTRAEPYFSMVYSATAKGLAEARVMQRDGVIEKVSTLYSHALLPIERIGDTGTLSLRYSQNPMLLSRLDEEGVWTSDVTLKVDDTEVAQGSFTLEYLRQEDTQIGACTYATWVVKDTLALQGGAPISYIKHFSPELGLVLRVLRLDENGQPLSLVAVDEISIELDF